MKKFITLLISICICAAAMSGFAACGNTPSDAAGGGHISEGMTPSEDQDDGGYMPPPEEGHEVPEGTPSADMAVPTPSERQTILLWNENNIPAYNQSYQHSSADPDDFIPYIESYPAQGEIKGAVLVCPGGAFQFRSMQSEGYSVAEQLSQRGYQCFVVSYRLRP